MPDRSGGPSAGATIFQGWTTLGVMEAQIDVTRLLLRWSGGDQEALDRLMSVLYDQLRAAAQARLRHERSDHTLNTTALVHEVYLKLVDARRVEFKDRVHFLATASQVMRHMLVDYARRRSAEKRGGIRQRVELDEERLLPDADVEPLLELDEALRQLEARHPRQAKAIEHCYFGGLVGRETAQLLGVSDATVERDLRFARTYLAQALDSERQGRANRATSR